MFFCKISINKCRNQKEHGEIIWNTLRTILKCFVEHQTPYFRLDRHRYTKINIRTWYLRRYFPNSRSAMNGQWTNLTLVQMLADASINSECLTNWIFRMLFTSFCAISCLWKYSWSVPAPCKIALFRGPGVTSLQLEGGSHSWLNLYWAENSVNCNWIDVQFRSQSAIAKAQKLSCVLFLWKMKLFFLFNLFGSVKITLWCYIDYFNLSNLQGTITFTRKNSFLLNKIYQFSFVVLNWKNDFGKSLRWAAKCKGANFSSKVSVFAENRVLSLEALPHLKVNWPRFPHVAAF